VSVWGSNVQRLSAVRWLAYRRDYSGSLVYERTVLVGKSAFAAAGTAWRTRGPHGADFPAAVRPPPPTTTGEKRKLLRRGKWCMWLSRSRASLGH
jgi:hypothetical protein